MVFMNNLAINVEDDGIITISRIDEVTLEGDLQERVRRKISNLSGELSTTTSSVETTEDLFTTSSNGLVEVGCPFADVEVSIIEKFSDGNGSIGRTIFTQNVEISDTPRSSVSIVGSDVSF